MEGIPGVENVDVTELVDGHMAYRSAIPKLLRKVGFIVLSDEFTEIEDPDPDRHRERQRELISELDEARKELEKEDTKKKRFTFFGRAKEAAKKKDWETYEDPKADKPDAPPETDPAQMPNGGVLFDVDAIRAELARSEEEEITIKELSSTLPPLKAPGMLGPPANPYGLRHSKSFGDHTYTAPAVGPYRGASSSTALDGYSAREGNNGYKSYGDLQATNGYGDSDSEDEFGNRRRRPGEEEDVMSFDMGPVPVRGAAGRSVSYGYQPPPPPSQQRYTVPSQPELKGSSTFSGGQGRNVWADDDDEDEFGGGGEGEMTLSFA